MQGFKGFQVRAFESWLTADEVCSPIERAPPAVAECATDTDLLSAKFSA